MKKIFFPKQEGKPYSPYARILLSFATHHQRKYIKKAISPPPAEPALPQLLFPNQTASTTNNNNTSTATTSTISTSLLTLPHHPSQPSQTQPSQTPTQSNPHDQRNGQVPRSHHQLLQLLPPLARFRHSSLLSPRRPFDPPPLTVS